MMKKLSIQINHRSIGFFCSDEALVVRIDLKQNSMIINITQGQPAQRAKKKQPRGRGPRSVEPSIFGNYITISYALNSVTDRPLLFKLYVCWLNISFFFAFSLTPLDKLLQRYDKIGFLEL